MDLTLEQLWGVWLLTLVVALLIIGLILWAIRSKYATLSWGVALFIAGLLAAIAVFIGANYVNTTDFTQGQQVSFYILLALAIIVPLIGLFMIFWRKETKCFSCGDEEKEVKVVVKETIKEEIIVKEDDPQKKCDPCHKHKVPIKSCSSCSVGY